MRGRIALASTLTVAVTGILLLPAAWLGWAAAVPVATSVGALVLLAILRPAATVVAVVVIIASSLSMLASLMAVALGQVGSTGQGVWGMLEIAAILVLLAVVVRVGHGAPAVLAGMTAVGAHALWLLRFVPDVGFGGVLLWSLGTLVAVVIGGYPRLAERRMRDRVARATERQRHRLERDLHDYVAHDISGILAQAQSAQFATPNDATALRAALANIESAAAHALETMDRTMALLRDPADDTAPTAPPPAAGIAELPAVVAAYAATTGATIETSLPDASATVSAEVGAVVHRIVVEALTNIRRHAPASHLITVAVTIERDRVRARVADDGGTLPVPNGAGEPARGGTGLAAAAALVEDLHGTLRFGASGAGWMVEADIPLTDRWPRQ